MAGRIQGITVEIGGDTTKLQTALKGVNSEIRNGLHSADHPSSTGYFLIIASRNFTPSPEDAPVITAMFISSLLQIFTFGFVYCPWFLVLFPHCIANFGHRCRQPKHITHFFFTQAGFPPCI